MGMSCIFIFWESRLSSSAVNEQQWTSWKSVALTIVTGLRFRCTRGEIEDPLPSSRSKLTGFNCSIGWKDALLILRYGTRWRKARKMMQTPFERIKVGRYKATQEHQTAILLMNVLQNPSELDRHVHRRVRSCVILASDKISIARVYIQVVSGDYHRNHLRPSYFQSR